MTWAVLKPRLFRRYRAGMHLEFYGAADGVTGSLHRLHVQGRDILIDCGMFQGRRAEANRRNRQLPAWAPKAHAAVLSHAHIDHSGNMPTLVERGFQGDIYCTPATRDLCAVMLRDSARIQEQDAAYLNRKFGDEEGFETIEPLYTEEDADAAVARMKSLQLYTPREVAPGVKLCFHNAGHVLGSAIVELNLEEGGKHTRLVFTGDLGREELPLLKRPDVVPEANVLITESTYGDRLHPDYESIDEVFARIVHRTVERKGRIYVPTFALERAQELLFLIRRLQHRNAIPEIPVYIDSPLATSITDVYRQHPQSLSRSVRRILERGEDPFAPDSLQLVSDVQESIRLQESSGSAIIIAGAGMCEGGRIVHHFRTALEKPENSVVIIGFMAQHTLGRRLVERRREVRVLGMMRDVWAEIAVLNGLSAHADQEDLVEYATATERAGRLDKLVLVHGEDDAKAALSEKLREAIPGCSPILSRMGERIEL